MSEGAARDARIATLCAEWKRLLALTTPGYWSCVALEDEGDWHIFRRPWTEATVPIARLYHSDDHDQPTRERAGHDARLIVWMQSHAEEILAALESGAPASRSEAEGDG